MVKDVKDLHVDRRRILLNTPHVKETSGAIANFKTDVPANLKKCVVEIDPVQDLHGYEYPWPPGGGKNKFDGDASYQESIANFIIGTNGSASGARALDLPAEEYIISFKSTVAGTSDIRLFKSDGTYFRNSSSKIIVGLNQYTINCTEAVVGIVVYINATDFSITEFMIRLSSVADSSYAPYSNICPISGRTEMEVWKSGINIWDEEWEVGMYNPTTGEKTDGAVNMRCKNALPVKPNTTYYCKSPYAMYVFEYKADGTFLGYTTVFNNIVTTKANSCYMRFHLLARYGITYNHDISINYPSADHEYHSYQGQTYDVTFPSEAGTAYGGTLDLLSGELVVDRAMVDLGSLNWNKGSGGTNVTRFYTTAISQLVKRYAVTELPNFVCSIFVAETENKGYAGIIKNTITVNPIGTLSVYSPIGYEDLDATAFQAAMDGVQLCYELANPTTYQLTPQTLKSLRGVNNIWSDAGDTTVKYWGH